MNILGETTPDCSDALADALKRAALASNCLAVGIFDETGQVLEANTGMRRLLCEPCRGDGCAAQFANPRFRDLWQRSGEEQGFSGYLSMGDGKRIIRSIKANARRRNGLLEIMGEVDAAALDRNVTELVELNRKITNLERELLRKNRWLEAGLETITRKERLNAALAEINEAIRTCADELELFAELCAISVRCCLFKLARVVRPDANRVFADLAAEGDTEFLRGLRIQLDPAEPEGQGPIARAFRSGTAQVSNNFQTDPTTSPWHNQARRHGIAAAASIPIGPDEQPHAVLSVYADKVCYFGDDELTVLLKIAADIGFAVAAVRQRQALRQSEERYRQVFEHAPLGLVDYDQAGTIIDCNAAYVAILGATADQVIGFNLLRDLRDQRVIDAVRQSLLAGRGEIEHLYRSVLTGKVTPVRGFFAGIRDAGGTIASGIGVVEDFSERRALEDHLRRSEERFRLAAYAASLGVWEYHPGSRSLRWDARMCQLHGCALGRAPKDFAGWRRFVHPDDRRETVQDFFDAIRSNGMLSRVIRVTWPTGAKHSLQLFARVFPNRTESSVRVVGVCFDVTEQQRAAEQIHQLALHDPLTKLANRRLLFDRLQQSFARADRQGFHGALLLLDLDGFKQVNDTQGHDVGDELLIELANRLRGSCGASTRSRASVAMSSSCPAKG